MKTNQITTIEELGLNETRCRILKRRCKTLNDLNKLSDTKLRILLSLTSEEVKALREKAASI